MPLGNTQTMSSMAGPRQAGFYDAQVADQMKRMLEDVQAEIRQVERNKKLSSLEKYKRTEALKSRWDMLQDRLSDYMTSQKLRNEYKKAELATQNSDIIPEIESMQETKSANVSEAKLGKPSGTETRATQVPLEDVGAGWGNSNWDENLSSAKYPAPDPSGLSVRTQNYLANNVNTIDDLLNLTEDDVLEARNTSPKTWNEITKLKSKVKVELSQVEDLEDVARIGKNPDMLKAFVSGQYGSINDNPSADRMAKLTGEVETFVKDLDKKIKQKQTLEDVKNVKPSKKGMSLIRGLGRTAALGLAEAPALEFLSPPSAGPSDESDPVYQFERGQMSAKDFYDWQKKATQAPKVKSNLDPLQKMVYGITSK